MTPDAVLLSIRPVGHESKAGWIFDNGQIVPCSVMAHRDVLPKEYRDRYEALLDNYNDMMNADLSMLGDDEHPAMHRFDPAGDSNDELMKELANANFIRFGIVRKNDVLLIELSGSKSGVERHRDMIAYMVAALGIERVTLVDVLSRYHTRTILKQFG